MFNNFIVDLGVISKATLDSEICHAGKQQIFGLQRFSAVFINTSEQAPNCDFP